jgi:hypothetical protein
MSPLFWQRSADSTGGRLPWPNCRQATIAPATIAPATSKAERVAKRDAEAARVAAKAAERDDIDADGEDDDDDDVADDQAA